MTADQWNEGGPREPLLDRPPTGLGFVFAEEPEELAMTWDDLLAHCLSKPGAWRDEPWEGDIVVKVGSKIFAFLGSATPLAVGLKCGRTREQADEWLLRYPDDASVMAYIGRSGWNSLRAGGAIPDDEILEAVDASYDTVVSKLPKKDRPAGS